MRPEARVLTCSGMRVSVGSTHCSMISCFFERSRRLSLNAMCHARPQPSSRPLEISARDSLRRRKQVVIEPCPPPSRLNAWVFRGTKGLLHLSESPPNCCIILFILTFVFSRQDFTQRRKPSPALDLLPPVGGLHSDDRRVGRLGKILKQATTMPAAAPHFACHAMFPAKRQLEERRPFVRRKGDDAPPCLARTSCRGPVGTGLL